MLFFVCPPIPDIMEKNLNLMEVITVEKPFFGRDTWAEIDLDAVEHNILEFQKVIPKKTKILCAVKANAYGHGSILVAKTALEAGADYLGVAFLDEALELRNAGIDAPILVLGHVPPYAMETAIQKQITLTIFEELILDQIEKVANKLRQPVKCHVKVDTGMSRLGLQPDQVCPLLQRVKESDFVEVEGIFTHFATADQKDKAYYERQYRIFDQMVNEVRRQGFDIPLIHASNSAAAIEYPERSYDMIRIGIAMYGYYPSDEVDQAKVNLKPAMSLHSKVSMVKQLPVDVGISYGKTYVTKEKEWIATIPIGYADGILRALSNKGEVLINQKRVPIVGRVCMDQLMVRVDESVNVGDEVIFFGTQGEATLPIEEVAALLHTISYEVACCVGRRVPRVYKRNNQVIQVVNYLLDNHSFN